jgi:hypothetical protein
MARYMDLYMLNHGGTWKGMEKHGILVRDHSVFFRQFRELP